MSLEVANGDLDGIPGSWLYLGQALATVVIWGMDHLSLSLYCPAFQNTNNVNLKNRNAKSAAY